KLLVNQTLYAQGLHTMQVLGTVFDGIARHTAEGYAFQRHAAEHGFRAAVRERDEPFGDAGRSSFKGERPASTVPAWHPCPRRRSADTSAPPRASLMRQPARSRPGDADPAPHADRRPGLQAIRRRTLSPRSRMTEPRGCSSAG